MKLQNHFPLIVLILIFFPLSQIFGQSKTTINASPSYFNTYFGIGLGLEYGGIGIQAEYLPSKYLGIFAGGGYNLLDPAFNVGVNMKLLPGKKFCPTLTAMYGYNAVLKLKDFTGTLLSHSKTYFGPTIGAGVEIRVSKNDKDKFSFGIRVPFRNKEFRDKYNALKDAGHKFDPDILPVTFSIGYHFGIGQKLYKN